MSPGSSAIVVFLSVLSLAVAVFVPQAALATVFDVEIIPARLYPGAISKVSMNAQAEGVRILSVQYKGEKLPLVSDDNGTTWCLLGIGLDEPPGRRLISIIYGLEGQDREDVETVAFTIHEKEYPREYLKVSRKMVEFSGRILKRVREDQSAIRAAVSGVDGERYFHGPFIRPVKGRVSSPFGLRRYFNNKPRSPHLGVDLTAPMGTPVLACNRGKVVLVRDCYLSGKTVVIDHGLGLYSLYAHLDRVLVRPGAVVEKGEKIGLSGISGRATGPHLHWGISLYEKRVDPLALVEIF